MRMTVAFRPRNKRDHGKPYVSKEAQRLKIGVQRFAVLMAAEEVEEAKRGDSEVCSPSIPHASEMTEN